MDYQEFKKFLKKVENIIRKLNDKIEGKNKIITNLSDRLGESSKLLKQKILSELEENEEEIDDIADRIIIHYTANILSEIGYYECSKFLTEYSEIISKFMDLKIVIQEENEDLNLIIEIRNPRESYIALGFLIAEMKTFFQDKEINVKQFYTDDKDMFSIIINSNAESKKTGLREVFSELLKMGWDEKSLIEANETIDNFQKYGNIIKKIEGNVIYLNVGENQNLPTNTKNEQRFELLKSNIGYKWLDEAFGSNKENYEY